MEEIIKSLDIEPGKITADEEERTGALERMNARRQQANQGGGQDEQSQIPQAASTRDESQTQVNRSALNEGGLTTPGG